MSANRKKWESVLFSGAGVGAMWRLLVAVGVIASSLRARLDLTEEKLYTLSEGTRKILSQIDTPVEIHFYFSRSNPQIPGEVKNFARRVEDLLEEYRRASGGKILVKKFDPQPDTDAEDSARLDGVEGRTLSAPGVINLSEKIYLGLAVVCLDQKSTISFLDPSRENLLEYDITRAISRVIHPAKPEIGVMSGLPVFGQFNPMARSSQQPWWFIKELQRDYKVRRIEPTAEEIDKDLSVLVVIHPSKLSEETLFALDQFVLRGGKLVAFLDPLSYVQLRSAPNMTAMMQQPTSSTLGKLLEAWGLKFDTSKVVADPAYRTPIRRGDQVVESPTWLSLVGGAISKSDPATADIDRLLLVMPGAFTGTPAEGLQETVLLKTSDMAGLVDRTLAQFGGDVSKELKSEGKEFALAVRLAGRFKTAFPEGKPAKKDAEKDENEDDSKEKKEGDKAETFLKESGREGVVVLVGDTDLLFDDFSLRMQRFLGQLLVSPLNGNLFFAQNLVDQAAGDTELIKIRSKAVKSRPFTVIQNIQKRAIQKYQDTIRKLEQDVQEAQRRINELQRQKDASQRFILSPEQEAEIRKLRVKEANTNKELRRVRKELRREVESLQRRLQIFNIAGMPLLIAVVGVALAMIRRKRRAAR